MKFKEGKYRIILEDEREYEFYLTEDEAKECNKKFIKREFKEKSFFGKIIMFIGLSKKYTEWSEFKDNIHSPISGFIKICDGC